MPSDLNITELNENARRQYIDAVAAFTALEAAQEKAAQVRGGMFWKENASGSYLIRTNLDNSQKSLGPRSPETEAMFARFTTRKAELAQRVTKLKEALVTHQRMNRALHVGRSPQILVDILRALHKADVAQYFLVVGTHALYAYEAAAGVRFSAGALATQDVDLLWDTRTRLTFVAQMQGQNLSMLGLLKKVDPSFELRDDQLYTAVNDSGFEVDIIRREAADHDPHPLRLTENAGDFGVVQAKNAGVLLSSPVFDAVIVSTNGHMARMRTVAPMAFVGFKRWMANQQSRDGLKKSRDVLQAELVERVVQEYLPNWLG
ncbi:MAG: hypothetical protein HYZ45_07350 [Burkholderiales bacterium]|nr:hypothetical protein [Burkholderiales bacterium]